MILLIYIGLHLHAYQPPTQPQEVIDKIYRESYDPVIRFIEDNPSSFISLDLAKSLGERMPQEFLQRIRALHVNQRIELVNTAAYHYLLPLVPGNVVKRQLELNREFYQENFTGRDPVPGVFLPELAYSPKLPRLLFDRGYPWFLADDRAFSNQRRRLPLEDRSPQNWIPVFQDCGAILQSQEWHEKLIEAKYESGKHFAYELLKSHRRWRAQIKNDKDSYVVIAVDFETFGHHHKGLVEKFFPSFFAEIERWRKNCEVVRLDFIFNHFIKIPVGEEMQTGSWATSKEDLDRGIPFPLWNHPDNPFHRAWNEFMNLTFEVAPPTPSPELQELLNKAFYSCSPWQYSNGNKGVAGWCLPMFERIISLLPEGPEKNKIRRAYQIILELVK